MRKNRRIAALLTAGLLALTPCVSAGMSVFAAADLQITDPDKQDHDYEAYALITGTLDDGKLKNLEWGAGVTPATVKSKLKTNATVLGIEAPADDASVDDIAKLLSGISDAEKLQKLAKILATCTTTTKTKLEQGTGTKTDTFSATGLTEGWYLIIDETENLATGDAETGVRVKSADILKLTGDTDINAKHDLPTLEKKIVEGENKVDANTAAIGEDVKYNIDLKVPDVRGYDKYYYVVEDTLSAGLTYNDDLIIKLNGNAVDEDEDDVGDSDTGDFYVTHENGNIKVVFVNAVEYFKNKNVGDPIVIEYTATLNSDAVITDAGNPNTAQLKYSNDPNFDTNETNKPGTPDEPKEPGDGEKSVFGETPEDKVITYTTAVKLRKVDQSGNKLTGAEFTLTGSDLKNVKITSGSKFEASESGDYWLLNDGTYTKTAPVSGEDGTEDKYKSTTQKYKKVDGAEVFTEEAANTGVVAAVNSDGYITFAGLKPGTYTLHESKVPDGYNAGEDITFTIAANTPLSGPSNWTVDDENIRYNTEDNAFYLAIENRYGATLPSTGGVGTKLFYLFGGMLAVGSGVVLVTKKRMSYEK